MLVEEKFKSKFRWVILLLSCVTVVSNFTIFIIIFNCIKILILNINLKY